MFTQRDRRSGDDDIPVADPLGVLAAAQAVMERAVLVGIDAEKVESVASELAARQSPAP